MTESIGHWARTAEFDEPIRLGAIEAAVLARPLPETAREAPQRGSRALSIVAGAVFLAVAAAFPLLGYAFMWGAAHEPDPDLAGSLMIVAGTSSLLGSSLPLTALLMWIQERRRDTFVTLAAVVSPIISITAAVLLWTSRLEATSLVMIGSAAGVVLSVVLCLLAFLASKPGPPEGPRFELTEVTQEEAVRLRERAIALHVLYDRGLVDFPTYRKVIDMPLGSWGDLDAERRDREAGGQG